MAESRTSNPNRGMSLRHQAVVYGLGLLLFMFGRAEANYWPFSIWLVVTSIAYICSLNAHPLRNCWYCKGGGKHFGWIWNYGSRICKHCKGYAKVPRFGVRVLGLPHEGWRTRKK